MGTGEAKSAEPSGTGPEGTVLSEERRGFLKTAAVVLYAAVGVLLALPFIKTLLTPHRMRRSRYAQAGKVAQFPVGQPVEIKFGTPTQDAFYHEQVLRGVWVIRHEDGSVTVFSPVCPHLGCYYKWSAEDGQFQCPCHSSTFSKDGAVLGGPAPRPLDTLPHQVESGTLYIRWVDYTPGISEKVAV